MRRAIVTLACVVVAILPASVAADAVGTVFGSLSTASTLGMGHGNFGLAIGLADATSFAGSFNYGLSAHMDGRVKIGLVDADGGDTELAIGADFKYQIVSITGASKGPFDMAIGGLFEYADYGGLSVIQLGGLYTGSYPIKLQTGGVLTPYGRFNARVEILDSDFFGSESNLEIGLNAGVHWQVTSALGLFGEFQIDGNDGVFLGLEFNAL